MKPLYIVLSSTLLNSILLSSILLSSILLGLSPAHAVTFVVDNQNPRAADTNAGTRAEPFKTVGAAAKLAQAGDEVLVRPGTYRESVTLSNSGAAGKPIVFRSEVSKAAVISGSDVITDWKLETPGVWSMDAPALIDRNPANVGTHQANPEWIYVNGFPLEKVEKREQLAPGSFFLDFEARRVMVAP